MLELDHIIGINGVDLMASFLCISSLLLVISDWFVCCVSRYLVDVQDATVSGESF